MGKEINPNEKKLTGLLPIPVRVSTLT